MHVLILRDSFKPVTFYYSFKRTTHKSHVTDEHVGPIFYWVQPSSYLWPTMDALTPKYDFAEALQDKQLSCPDRKAFCRMVLLL